MQASAPISARERRGFDYVRHGTQTLIAAFGRVLGVVGDTRTEQDYASFPKTLFATGAPTTAWHVVADNLATHVSESVVRLVADLCRIEDELGGKGKSAVPAAMVTRAAFLRAAAHRSRFPFTPRHASWLNQIEIWFSIRARSYCGVPALPPSRASRRGSSRSSPPSTRPRPSHSSGPDQASRSRPEVDANGVGSSGALS